ncbi:hypothetical protein FRC08_007103 [Ceratobasidium sp. 394]|nr:hypothetical protein FRC08_007103 [Ceratobasidium sp. 394]
MMNPHRMLIPSSHQSSPSAGINVSIKSALQEWRTTRRLLASAIQSYLAACTTLRVSCVTPLRHPEEQSILEDALVTVDSELEPLALEERKLHDMRISTLGMMRNNSTTLARINTLPSEILAKILALSRSPCIHDCRFTLHHFICVCVRWRQVIMNTTYLWAHIDISPNTPSRLTTLLLTRSGNAPLHVHVYEPEMDEIEEELVYRLMAMQVMQDLSPHLHRVRILEIVTHSDRKEFVNIVLNLWLDHGKMGVPGSLLVYRPKLPYSRSQFQIISLRNQGETPDNTERMLLALTTLHLQHVKFDWESSAYRGLVDLQLSFWGPDNVSISMSQLASILSANPLLSTLKLGDLAVDYTEDWTQSTPIVLEHLKVLNIVYMRSKFANLLLSLITLPSPLTELSVGISLDSTEDNQLVDFLARSRITTLYCGGDDSVTSWNHILQLPYSLRTLVLHRFSFYDALINEASAQSSQLVSPSPPVVILLDCDLDLEFLKRFINRYNLRHLRLEQCRLSRNWIANPSLNSIRTSLSEMYPDTQCLISSVDSTERLACRTIFDL